MARTCLGIAGVAYENEYITFDELKASRGEAGMSDRFPLGSVPTLQLPNGTTVTQSGALARYAGKMAKLYPEDPEQALLVDEVIETCADCMISAPQDPDPELKKKKREEFAAGKLRVFFSLFASCLQRDPSGPFVLGASFSVADLSIYGVVAMLRKGSFDHVSAEYDKQWPAIGAMIDALEANETFAPYKL